MLRIYNTLTREKEDFKPIEAGKVGMYVCGMTVYDYCHLGHARVLVSFDVVVRYLRSQGYEVTYVRNITDIDDKIIKRAAENGEPVDALTERFIEAMHEDEHALNVLPPDIEPRATQFVPPIVDMVQKLIDAGHAYVGDNSDVYYDVSSFEGYGRLSNKRIADLRAGSRVEVDEFKDDPLDFVLWKAAKPGEPTWDSPWGPGRPGWHIECSAMSTQSLGNTFDIHGGGMDLQFPHHDSEIAQSEAATHQTFVNLWMHNGFVRVDEEKMSKSLGNFFTVREVLRSYPPEVVRYFIVASHYRSPLNYSNQQLDDARLSLNRLYTALRGLPDATPDTDDRFWQAFCTTMDDDFNTPEALAVMFELAHEINRVRNEQPAEAARLAAGLKRLGAILGILQADPERFLQSGAGAQDGGLGKEEIEKLIDARNAARQAKDYAEADRIRDLLQSHAITLEDGADGTTWRTAE
jgi:cysteinyl-tRNA synthetase